MNPSLRTLMTGTRSGTRTVRSTVRFVHPAWLSLAAAVVLSLLGIYGIDIANAHQSHDLSDLAPQAWKQVVFLVVGMLAAVVIALPHLRWVAMSSWVLAFVSMGLLIFLLLPGVPDWLVSPINGTRSWIKLPGFNAQPGELAKVSYVLFIANLLRRGDGHRTFMGVFRLFAVTAPPVLLIAMQPDLGGAFLFIPSLVAMLVAGGARIRHLVILGLIGVSLLPMGWPLLRDYQKQRLITLVRQLQGDQSGAQDESFQAFTALRLIGAGGVHGQSDAHARALVRFNRLPEAHNDMVFSVLVCRFGLVGAGMVLVAYAVWLAGAVLTAALTKDPFGRIVPVGLATFVAGQAIVNIGMNVGIFPIIGITLPFVSYGGSSLITCWVMTGLIFGIAMRKNNYTLRPSFEYAEDDASKRR